MPPIDSGSAADVLVEPPLDARERLALSRIAGRLLGHVPAPLVLDDRYVVERELGSGGMGSVVLAWDRHLRRKVALKFLRLSRVGGLEVGVARARLRVEAQRLAGFTHPNVVTVYDVAPLREAGYFAMEFIDGSSLRTWVRDQPRALSETLDVLVAVGRGLQAAHERGITHRDVKPDNVLIGKDGRPRLADFGLAQASLSATDTSSSDGDVQCTACGDVPRVAGTRAYLAPELWSGRDADHRSDQYAFCVMACECLAVDPTVRLTRRRARLWRSLRRGLSVEPDDRWPSMADLLEDLDAPVIDLPRWGGVLVLSGAAAALVAVFAAPANDCAARASNPGWSPWDRWLLAARLGAASQTYAPVVTDTVLRSLDAYAQQWQRQYEVACVASATLASEGTVVPAFERRACLEGLSVELRATLRLLSERGPRAIRQSAEIVENLPAPANCAVTGGARATFDGARRNPAILDALAQARALERLGELEPALASADEAVARARAVGAWALMARGLQTRGDIQNALGQEEPLRQSYKASYLLAVELGLDGVAATTAAKLATADATRAEDWGEAERWVRHAAAAVERSQPPPGVHSQVLSAHAALELARGNYDSAVALAAERLALIPDGSGGESLARAGALNQLGLIEQQRGNWSLADDHHSRSLALVRAALGREHPAVADMLNNLASVKIQHGETNAARTLHQEALRIRIAQLGPDHAVVASSYNNLAVAAFEADEYDRAERLYHRALEIYDAIDVPLGERTDTLGNLGNLRYIRGDYAAAVVLQRRALFESEASAGADHPRTALVLNNLGAALKEAGALSEARVVLARALVIRRRVHGPRHAMVAQLLYNIAECAFREGDHDDAVAAARGSLEIRIANGDRIGHGASAWLLAKIWSDRAPALALALAREARAPLVEASADVDVEALDRWIASRVTPTRL